MRKMRLWYTCTNQKMVEGVFYAHYTRQLETTVILQEHLQSQVSVKANGLKAISTLSCRILAVQKKLFVESGQIVHVLVNINR